MWVHSEPDVKMGLHVLDTYWGCGSVAAPAAGLENINTKGGWFKPQKNISSTFWGAGKSKIKVLGIGFPDEGLLPDFQMFSFLLWERERGYEQEKV